MTTAWQLASISHSILSLYVLIFIQLAIYVCIKRTHSQSIFLIHPKHKITHQTKTPKSTMVAKLFLLFTLLSQAAISSLSERCHPEDKRVLLQIKKELNNPTLLSSWKPHADCCHFSWYGVGCSPFNNRVGYLSISNDTDLVAQFPPSIGNLLYLESLFIFQLPNLTGTIPTSITNLTKLQYLTISATGVSGPIPKFTTQFKSLVNLDLSLNRLSGPLLPSLYKLPSLQGILFSNNMLSGS